MNTGFGANNGVITKMNMISDTSLSRTHNICPCRAGTGDAGLRNQQIVFTNLAIVSNHNHVIDARSAANNRLA